MNVAATKPLSPDGLLPPPPPVSAKDRSGILWLIPGDKVTITGLQSAKGKLLNGCVAHVLGFKKGRLKVRVNRQKKPLGLQRDNLKFNIREYSGPKRPAPPAKIHVLMPCHVASPRRQFALQQTLKALVAQVVGQFAIFIGLSGSAEARKTVVSAIAMSAEKRPDVRWYVHGDWGFGGDDNKSIPQFEIIRALTHISCKVEANAWILFNDNDDMFHPQRISAFAEFVAQPDRVQNLGTQPFSIPAKLLIGEGLDLKYTRLECFLPDTTHGDSLPAILARHPSLRGCVSLASKIDCDDSDTDAAEYFDFCVHTHVLTQFLEATPVSITSHRYCDLRFLTFLERISSIEPLDIPPHRQLTWLIAHHKQSMAAKRRSFDMHGKSAGHAADHASMTVDPTRSIDHDFAKRFNHLSPKQV